jgi:hypothetical protein
MSLSSQDIITITNYINVYRQKHKSKLISHNQTISNFSQSYSNELLKTNTFKHSNNKLYGENLYKSFSSVSKPLTNAELLNQVKKAIDSWYNEVKFYNFETAELDMKTLHFTQLIWNNSTEYGFGISSNNGTVVVCMNYNPRGNMLGQFKQNVFK